MTVLLICNTRIYLLQRAKDMMQGCLLSQRCLITCVNMRIPLLVSPCVFMATQPTPLRVHLQAPFREDPTTPEMMAFNRSMSTVRVSVEWIFGDIVNYFKFMDFKKDLKIGLSQVGKMYIVSAMLRNAVTCLYGNTTSEFFQLEPPTLHEYFS